ncbi:MFS transporter [Streptomyces katrae]|uniref:MFS transporter n=1 Tax=Streptomyces katrae TaxID=68223 RepID=A0ABT7GS24_9ACTN|nr:MFS transporter [Streptomyces katrae]MDK9496111.1 MFS transporter [Streptomyces katrae]
MRYRDVATRKVGLLGLVMITGRLPVAMAPIALVFLVRETEGGYRLGALLSAAFVAGEAVGAPLLGVRVKGERIRLHVGCGLAAAGVLFAGLAFARTAPEPVLIALAFLVGVAPAASPGGIQVLQANVVAEEAVQKVFSLGAALTQGIWAAAPVLVTLLALQVSPGAPLLLAAVLAGTAALLLVFLKVRMRRPEAPARPAGRARTLASAWPVFLMNAAGMYLLASLELFLPALLEARHISLHWAGVLLGLLAAVNAAAALCYGLRPWPGSHRTQSTVLLLATSLCVCLVGVVPGLLWITLLLVLAGFLDSAAALSRSLSLRAAIPQDMHLAAYSVNYSVIGIGYGGSAVAASFLLAHGSPLLGIAAGAAFTSLLTLAAHVGERRPRAETRGRQSEATPAADAR